MTPKKRKKKGYPFEAGKDGFIRWAKSHFCMTCCDCGLRHLITVDKDIGNTTLKTNDKWLALRFYRDDVITEDNRKRKKDWKCRERKL